MIERVELLTGGASSVYGADAVAGVVNFKLIKNFEGVKASANYSFYDHHNTNPDGVDDAVTAHNYQLPPSSVRTGQTKDLSVIFGFNTPDQKGNATAYVTYRNVAPVVQASYDYSACTLGSGKITTTGGKFTCSGSATSFPGDIYLADATGKLLDNFPGSATAVPGGKATGSTLDSSGNLVPYSSAANAYNYGPLNYFQRPDERWTAGAFLHYEFNEHADVYSQLMFMRDSSTSQLAASGDFGTLSQVHCSNPNFTAQELAAWCGGSTSGTTYLKIFRRDVEGGPRQSIFTHESSNLVLGVRGKINDAWTYDAYGQFNTVDQLRDDLNNFSSARLSLALDAIPDGKGGANCASGASGCVPYNVFKPNGVTQDALNYLFEPGIIGGSLHQYVVSANATGDLGQYGIKVPTAASSVKVNVGGEWREVSSSTQPDAAYQTNDLAGSGGAVKPVSGEIVSRELFTEINAPLVDDKPYARSLILNTGYRFSDYNLGFKTNTYNLGLEWSPMDELRFRGSWARAVRAPNVAELFAAQVVSLDGTNDPCSGAKPAASAQACLLEGISAAQYGTINTNSASQYNGLTGGNPKLQPETAITTSFGLGWTPAYLPGFRAQVDWYDISITNVIGAIGANTIHSVCDNHSLYCDTIHRDVNGSLWLSSQGYVVDTNFNGQALEQKGIDVDTSYAHGLGEYGRLNVSLVGTYLINNITVPLSALPSTQFDCVGYYGSNCGIPNPRWRHTVRATWETPWHGLDVAMAWRYYGANKLDTLSGNSNLRAVDKTNPGAGNDQMIADGTVSNTDARLSAESYIDLSMSVRINDKVTYRMGVNNLADKNPPLFGASVCSSGQCNGNTFPQVYDSLGRYAFAKITAQF